MATATSWISKAVGRAGGEACVRDSRITVWGLEAHRRLGMSDEQILSAIQGLRPEDLEAAWEYVSNHPAEIDQAIRENHEGEEVFVD